jgi:hypothetical protein
MDLLMTLTNVKTNMGPRYDKAPMLFPGELGVSFA